MIATQFDYHKASSVDEAIQMLQQYGYDAKLLAGGHSLIPTMKLRLATPTHLIDIGGLEALKAITDDGGHLTIGAAATHWSVASSATVQQAAPLLAEAAGMIGDIQVRNAGTLGGSIAHADPAADYPAPLLALGATVAVQGPGGKRTIPIADFFLGVFTTALEPEEIVTAVHIPKVAPGTGTSYRKFAQAASRFAIVGCAAVVTVSGGTFQEATVAFNGVSGAAFTDAGVAEALIGRPADAEHIAQAAEHAAAGVEALNDMHASSAYRSHLARVYAKRALTAALENA